MDSPRAPRTVAARRHRWPGRLALLIGILVFLVADVAAAGTLVARATLPQTTGTIHLAGPDGAITISRDQYGVPHVTASDQHDLFFAQGYVTAQDRLWQMEFNRRVATGRLAEILGPAALSADKFLRTIGLARSAQADVDALAPNLRAELDSYTAGVNAYLAANMNNLPLEFQILGFKPDLWHDTDSIAYGKVVALDLDGTWSVKLARADVLAKVGPLMTAALFPSYPADSPTLIDGSGTNEIAPNSESAAPTIAANASAAAALAAISPTQLTALRGLPSGQILSATLWLRNLLGNVASVEGSNDWVVSGAHTTTGMPLLANDPHLGIQYPSIWYEVGLRDTNAADHYNALGFSFPGVPGIIIGHNDSIAWGVTNGQVDDTDLYTEQLSADGTTYLYNGQQVPLAIRQETIKVRGANPVTITVRVTNHGPLLNDVVSNLKGATPVALQWTALQPGYSFAGFFELGAAQNWDDFNAALRDISISQNFVYADTNGNIGYRLSGWAPLRPAANGLVPVDGTTSANDWTGQVPFAAMPHLFNPPSGIIWTANNRIVGPDYPYYITNDWDIGFRAKRIEQLLTAKPKLSPDDIAAIQSDVLALPAQELLPAYLRAAQGAPNDTGAAAITQMFSHWDGTMTRQSNAAAFFEALTGHLIKDTVAPVLGGTTYNDWDNNEYSVSKLLFLRDSVALPLTSLFTTGAANRDARIRKAADEAFADLKTFFGTSDITQWHWGQLHQASFAHPLASVKPLNLIFPNASVARPGNVATVNVGGDSGFTSGDYSQTSLPSMREIIDLGNLDASRFVTTTGESGEPFDAHNMDLLPLWDSGRYQPMTFTPAAVSAAAVDVLTLEP